MRRINVISGILTVIEVITLVVWLALATGTPIPYYGNVAGFPKGLAAIVLSVGIIIEELIRYRLVRGVFPTGRALQLVAVGVVVEVVGWVAALSGTLGTIETGLAPAFGILFVTLAVEHALIKQATDGGPFEIRKVLDFSAIEAAGGAIWLVDPSIGTIVVLAVTSMLEHVQGLRE